MARIDLSTLVSNYNNLIQRFPETTYTLAKVVEYDDDDKPVWETQGAEEAIASNEPGEYAILRLDETEDGGVKQKVINTARVSEGGKPVRRRSSGASNLLPGQQIGKELTFLSDSWQLLVGNYQKALADAEAEKKRLSDENTTLRNEILQLKSGNEVGELVELGKTAMYMWQNNNIKQKLSKLWQEIQPDLSPDEQQKMSRLLTGALAKSELESEKSG